MTTPLNAREEAREADSLQREAERGDAAGLREHIHRIYSEHGADELRAVLAKLKENEERRGISVGIEEHGGGLPDITITGTDTRTHREINVNFDAERDGHGEARIGRDSDHRVTEFTTPDGNKYELGYGADGSVNRITVPHGDGTSSTFEKRDGNWVDSDGNPSMIRDVTVDNRSGEIRIATTGGTDIQRPDGSRTELNSNGDVKYARGANGAETTYAYDSSTGALTGYEARHNGHTETLTANGDGSYTLNRGSVTDTFPPGSSVEVEPDGDRRITAPPPDDFSFEGRTDGTTISRDRNGHITEMTRCDGNTVRCTRDERGNLTGMEVRDGTGRVIESYNKDASGWHGTARDAAGNEVPIRDVRVNDRDGGYSVRLENNARVEHKVDGTVEHLDNRGRHVDSRADEYVRRLRDADVPMSAEEERALRADLERINSLDAGTRDRIYANLDRLATANTDATTRLTPEERSELVRSVAHNIAHPEDIQQGGKNSCTMANTEMLMASNHPDRYADMVTALATEGRYTAPNGRTVEAARDADGSLAANSDSYGVRSLGSELFQSAAMDLVLPPGQDYRSLPPDSPELEPRPPGVNPSSDSGERIYASPPPAGEHVTEDGRTVIRENRGDVDGDGEDDYYDWLLLADGRAVRGFTGTGIENKEAMLDALAPGDGYTRRAINSEDDLLAAYDTPGSPPLNVGVSLDSTVDVTGMAEGAAGTDAGNHAVTITYIDRSVNPPLVYFENSASGADHSYPRGTGVPLSTFVAAMRASRREALVRPHVGDFHEPGSPLGPPADGTAFA